MKERSIVFNDFEVRATLDNRKTQFRRVIKPPPEPLGNGSMIPLPPQCPYGYIGDQLWVKETWTDKCEWSPGIHYKAWYSNADAKEFKWKSPIHMPRKASRMTLEITDVKVQQLQDISEADAFAEGIESIEGTNVWKNYQIPYPSGWFYPHHAIDSFRTLWDSINNKKHPWRSNDWVWAVTYILI